MSLAVEKAPWAKRSWVWSPVTSGKIHFESERGKVELSGLSRRAYRPYRSEIQMVYQDPFSSLNPRLSVQENRRRTAQGSSDSYEF